MKEKNVNKMGVMPIGKLMISMGLPMILSMMLQAFYNIVDSAFVSNMTENGEVALNALTLDFPVQMLMVAIGIGTGVGTNALLAKSLGMNDRERASKAAGNAVFLAGIIYIIFVVFSFFGIESYVSSQTSNPLIYEMAVDYLRICSVASFGIVFFSVFEKVLQATGRSLFSTIAQVSGAVVNIILDPIMIYGLFGVPEMGVCGAAYATVIGQIVSFLIALMFHFRYDKEIFNGLGYIKPSAKTIKEIYSIGVPAIIAQALMSVMTYGLNIIFAGVSEAVVTAYGLFYKIQQFILFAAFGLRDAITPIVSFNYGMGSKERVFDGIKFGMGYTFCIMILGLVGLEIFANPLAAVFDLSGETYELCISAIRIISLSFIFAGANIALQGVFQALDSGFESLIIPVCRQFLLVLPVAWGFSLIARQFYEYTWLIWLTFIIAEGVSALIGFLFMKRVFKKRVS